MNNRRREKGRQNKRIGKGGRREALSPQGVVWCGVWAEARPWRWTALLATRRRRSSQEAQYSRVNVGKRINRGWSRWFQIMWPVITHHKIHLQAASYTFSFVNQKYVSYSILTCSNWLFFCLLMAAETNHLRWCGREDALLSANPEVNFPHPLTESLWVFWILHCCKKLKFIPVQQVSLNEHHFYWLLKTECNSQKQLRAQTFWRAGAKINFWRFCHPRGHFSACFGSQEGTLARVLSQRWHLSIYFGSKEGTLAHVTLVAPSRAHHWP